MTATTQAGAVDLDTPLLGPVGKKAADALGNKLDLHTVGDLVRHYPRRYVNRGTLTEIAGLALGEHVTVLAEVEKVTMRDMRQRRGKLMQVVLNDGRGHRLDATFFNPYKLKNVMVPGLRALFSGQVSRFREKLQLTHPEFEPLEESEGVRPFISIYPATQGFDSWQVARCVRQVLELLDDPTDPLPADLRRAEGLSELGRALRRIHLPETEADQWAAKNRLVWDEAMGVQLALALRRQRAVQRPAAANPHVEGGLLDSFDARLPYTLTAGQRSVGAEVAADLATCERGHVQRRGDRPERVGIPTLADGHHRGDAHPCAVLRALGLRKRGHVLEDFGHRESAQVVRDVGALCQHPRESAQARDLGRDSEGEGVCLVRPVEVHAIPPGGAGASPPMAAQTIRCRKAMRRRLGHPCV